MVRINKILTQLFIFPIRLYQLIISPLMGPGKCCYHPTCSNYMVEAIKIKGIVKGLIMGFLRIIRCNPWSLGGFDPVDKNKK